MDILISVIIPTYRRPFTMLQKALKSVLEQTHSNLEIIIVDDNSKGNEFRSDISKGIKAIKENRIKYIQHEENLGACAARNTGIDHSNGEFISFLDDDDEWIETKLELQLEEFNDKKIGLVYCDSYTIKVENSEEVSRKINSSNIRGMVFDELIKRNFVGSTSFPLIKKAVIEKCGKFNTNMHSAQDYEYWLRISERYKIECVNKPLVKYYNHDGERISTNYKAKIQGLEEIIRLYLPYLKKNPKIYSLKISEIIQFYYEVIGYRKAFRASWQAFKLHPFNERLYKNFIKITINKVFSSFN